MGWTLESPGQLGTVPRVDIYTLEHVKGRCLEQGWFAFYHFLVKSGIDRAAMSTFLKRYLSHVPHLQIPCHFFTHLSFIKYLMTICYVLSTLIESWFFNPCALQSDV